MKLWMVAPLEVANRYFYNYMTHKVLIDSFIIIFSEGEVIPIRLYLSGYDVTPSYKKVSNKFTVRYNN